MTLTAQSQGRAGKRPARGRAAQSRRLPGDGGVRASCVAAGRVVSSPCLGIPLAHSRLLLDDHLERADPDLIGRARNSTARSDPTFLAVPLRQRTSAAVLRVRVGLPLGIGGAAARARRGWRFFRSGVLLPRRVWGGHRHGRGYILRYQGLMNHCWRGGLGPPPPPVSETNMLAGQRSGPGGAGEHVHLFDASAPTDHLPDRDGDLDRR